VKIIGKRVVADWWRQQGHVLDALDVDDILSARPEYLVVGRGSPGNMVVAENLRRPWRPSASGSSTNQPAAQ